MKYTNEQLVKLMKIKKIKLNKSILDIDSWLPEGAIQTVANAIIKLEEKDMNWIEVKALSKTIGRLTIYDFDNKMPEDQQEILMSDGHEIWIHCYNIFDDETSFDDYLDKNVKLWWMPLPELPVKWE